MIAADRFARPFRNRIILPEIWYIFTFLSIYCNISGHSSLEEKIQAKQELINALNIRMESEQRELEELFEQKKRKELEAVSDIIEDAGLAPEEVTEVLQQYIESRRANAS